MPRTQATMAKPHRSVRASTKGKTVAPRDRKGPDKRILGTPRGDLAMFLHSELQRRGWSVREFFDALKLQGFDKKDDDTCAKWIDGNSTPRFDDLALIASALGYADWYALVAAVKRHANK